MRITRDIADWIAPDYNRRAFGRGLAVVLLWGAIVAAVCCAMQGCQSLPQTNADARRVIGGRVDLVGYDWTPTQRQIDQYREEAQKATGDWGKP